MVGPCLGATRCYPPLSPPALLRLEGLDLCSVLLSLLHLFLNCISISKAAIMATEKKEKLEGKVEPQVV